MTEDKKDRRIDLMMSASEVEALDEWRAAQAGVPGKSEAMRRLIRRGMTATTHAKIYATGCQSYLEGFDLTEREKRKPFVQQLLIEAAAQEDEIRRKVEQAVIDLIDAEVVRRMPRRRRKRKTSIDAAADSSAA